MKCFLCSKEIISPKNCLYCEKLFCSGSCAEAHEITYHRINKTFINNLNFNQPIRASPQKIKISKFITEGQILPKISYNQLYRLENFIQVMNENNKPYLLGSGSYGQVFLCINKKNNKQYAIKHMEKSRLMKALKTLSGIYTEINLQSRINHPNIVQLLYVRENHFYFDLVMEWAINGSLFDCIRKNGYLQEEISFKYFIQVVNAVYFLHENDLIHRDIKPENILLYEYDNIKLCDFGWCVGLNGGQRGTFCGTTEYMAPEMVNQKVYSKEIDIWSLGVLLYEMVHGHSPFIPNKSKFNEREVMENIKIHNLKFDKKVSKECKELICHLLDENRNKRYKIEDIFNSDFVKKYNKIDLTYILNNQYLKINIDKENYTQKKITQNKCKQIKEEDNNINNNHSKKISNIDNNLNNNICIYNNKNNEIEDIKREKTSNKLSLNKTSIYFYPIKINKDIDQVNNNIDTPRKNNNNKIPIKHNSSNNCKINSNYETNNIVPIKEKQNRKDLILEDNINDDIKISRPKYNIYENPMKKKQKEEYSFGIPINEDKDRESSIINNYSVETDSINTNKNNNNDLNHTNNYVNNNISTMIKRLPINAGNSIINNNSNKNNSGLNGHKKNCVKNNNKQNKISSLSPMKRNISNHNAKKKSIINNFEEHNIKKNNKKLVKNNSSYILNGNKNIYINGIKNKNNNNKEISEKKDEIFYINGNKIRYYSDINDCNFKNVIDPEIMPELHNKNNNIPSNNPNKSNLNGITKNININCIIFNKIIDEQNERKRNNSINNIILYHPPQSKISKTPVKNNSYKKSVIKFEKETIDNEDETKKNIHTKAKMKSKSIIKNKTENNINFDNQNNNKINENIYKNNNIILLPETHINDLTFHNKPRIFNGENQYSLFPLKKESLIQEKYNENNNDIIYKNSNMINNDSFLNKTIKLNNQKEIEDDTVKNKQINNSFNSGIINPIIKDNENKYKMISPVKILGYNYKKNDQKKDTITDINESSKIIDEREFEVENNDDDDEDEQQKTPKKTMDKIKIFPCKLISEITKKFN